MHRKHARVGVSDMRMPHNECVCAPIDASAYCRHSYDRLAGYNLDKHDNIVQ